MGSVLTNTVSKSLSLRELDAVPRGRAPQSLHDPSPKMPSTTTSTREDRSHRPYPQQYWHQNQARSVPIVTHLDHQIHMAGGTTTNLERLPRNLQASKVQDARDARDAEIRILQMTHEIGRLRQEVSYYQESHKALTDYFKRSGEIYSQWARLLQDTTNQLAMSEGNFLAYFDADLDSEGTEFSIL